MATGKLISVIQKEWGKELGEPRAELSENVLSAAHHLLLARTIPYSNSKPSVTLSPSPRRATALSEA